MKTWGINLFPCLFSFKNLLPDPDNSSLSTGQGKQDWEKSACEVLNWRKFTSEGEGS